MNNNMNGLYYCPVNNVWLNSTKMSNQPMNPYFMCPCMYSYNVPMNRSNPIEESEEYVEEYDYDDNFNEDEWEGECSENEFYKPNCMPTYQEINSPRNGTEGHPEYNSDDTQHKNNVENCFMEGIDIERVNIKEILD